MNRDIKNTRQPLNTFLAQGVLPFQKSPIVLSGGNAEPYYYSLGNQSTVPFVRLQGSGGTQKEFTWGETIEVLPGQNVQVQSASYMPGDIQIQSGRDIANRPRRITIPVPLKTFFEGDIPTNTLIEPLFPCDCRQARTAWLGCDLSTGAAEATPELTFVGINQQHSWLADVPSFFTSFPPVGKKYSWSVQFQGGTIYHSIPMGFYAQFAPFDSAMHLADYVLWSLQTNDDFRQGTLRAIFFYTLEY
jgi:hypothetical protein